LRNSRCHALSVCASSRSSSSAFRRHELLFFLAPFRTSPDSSRFRLELAPLRIQVPVTALLLPGLPLCHGGQLISALGLLFLPFLRFSKFFAECLCTPQSVDAFYPLHLISHALRIFLILVCWCFYVATRRWFCQREDSSLPLRNLVGDHLLLGTAPFPSPQARIFHSFRISEIPFPTSRYAVSGPLMAEASRQPHCCLLHRAYFFALRTAQRS